MAENKRLQEATAVIRRGDKETGREMLLDILQMDPENDTAWVWMSAVVDTDELRLECLEEALKFNPDNQMAHRGIAKLREKGVGETAVSDASPTTPKLSSTITATLSYFCRRRIIEKQYQLLPNEFAYTVFSDSGLFDNTKFRNIPIVPFPELEPLLPYFDAILFRKGGGSFAVTCIKVRDAQKIDNVFVPQALFVEVGQACLRHAPKVMYGQTAPITFEILEFFERDFMPDDEKRLATLKRIPGRKKVMVTVLAIDTFSRKVRKNYQPGVAGLFNAAYPNTINRWLAEEHTFSEAETRRAVANGGVKWGSILLGIVGGIVFALAIEFLLLLFQWESGWVVDMIGAITAVLIAIYARKIRVDNKRQGIITAALYGVVYYGILLFLFGYWLGLIWIWNIGWMIAWGAFLGRVTDP
ncbi:MAG: ECF transporter S component [Anaerolineae bacterium]|nr:ECF transporter S component [Anaerolineae bacterium]